MKTNEYLLILGGAQVQGKWCIPQAKKRGMKIWLTDKKENLEKFPEITEQADKVSILDFQDQNACVSWAVEKAKNYDFIAAYAFRELAVESATLVSEQLNLPTNSLEVIKLIRNKHECREKLSENGFRQPISKVCNNIYEAEGFMNENKGPWIIKPVNALGSLGVTKINANSELKYAINNLAEYSDDPFIIETFQIGEEFSAEGIFIDGEPHILSFTQKFNMGGPLFVETGHNTPATFDTETNTALTNDIYKALHVVGLNEGLFHVEFWLEENSNIPIIGEIHARPGGGFIHYMTEYITDIELYGSVFDQLLGRKVDFNGIKPNTAAAMRLIIPPVGEVVDVHNWDRILNHPNCILAESFITPGDTIKPLRSFKERYAYVVTAGKNVTEAANIADQLVKEFQIEVVSNP